MLMISKQLLCKSNKLIDFSIKKVANCLFIPKKMINFAAEIKKTSKNDESEST